MKKFLTTKEVAEMFSVSSYTVLRWISERKLEGAKIGRSYRFSEDNILKFVRERRV